MEHVSKKRNIDATDLKNTNTKNDFKHFIDVMLYESDYYFPCDIENSDEIIELLNILSININPTDPIMNKLHDFYYLNKFGISKKHNLTKKLHAPTLKFACSVADGNNFMNYVEPSYYERLIKFKNSNKVDLIKQLDQNKDPARYKIKDDIMSWIISDYPINFDINS